MVDEHLRKRRVQATRIDGNVVINKRQACVDAFNDMRSPVRVMCLSLMAGGCGLNLCGGNHLFVTDLHWNPANELQAADRIHRMGQTKPVTIHKFIVNNTIEQRVLSMQRDKLQLAKSVLDGFVVEMHVDCSSVFVQGDNEKRQQVIAEGSQIFI
jgi:SNF2 family DNA or RNA helicase